MVFCGWTFSFVEDYGFRFQMMKMKHILILTHHHFFDGDTRQGLSEWRNRDVKKKNLKILKKSIYTLILNQFISIYYSVKYFLYLTHTEFSYEWVF